MRYPTFKAAKAAGVTHGVHVLNQPNKEDNGWHYFHSFKEAVEFKETHPDPHNRTTIDPIR